jgi:hypothetical protein
MSGTSPPTKRVVGSPYSPSVGLASRDHAITPACFAQTLGGSYRPVFGLLLGWPKDRLKVAALVSVEGSDDNEFGGLLL